MDGTTFLSVTELPGEEISPEQLFRLRSRYGWAMRHCAGRDVLELACGPGPGLGALNAAARSVTAGDVSLAMVSRARFRYGDRLHIGKMDAGSLPVTDQSLDLIILFEAIYYLENPSCFIAECARVLRPGGQVLISTPNPDLFDFNPSPFAHAYLNGPGLTQLFGRFGFDTALFGSAPLSQVSARQRMLRPLKALAVRAHLMPRTMAGKRRLKRLVFGRPVIMPAELDPSELNVERPVPISAHKVNRDFKVLFLRAQLPRDACKAVAA